MRICEQCKSEIMIRKIPFGRVGAIQIDCCEHEAMQLTLKYSNTGKPDNKKQIFVEDL